MVVTGKNCCCHLFGNYSFSSNGVKEASDLAKVGQRRTALPTSMMTKEAIIDAIDGVTPQSTKIANLIKEKGVNVNIVGDRMFEENIPTSLLESSNPSDITAFYNYQVSIFLRSSRGEMIY
jgi:hypothetical protein